MYTITPLFKPVLFTKCSGALLEKPRVTLINNKFIVPH
jgi:hypothetical protein